MVNRKNFNPKVGDRVRFRQWDEMEQEFGLDYNENINCKFHFLKDMRYLCGTEFEVEEVYEGKVYGHNEHRWTVSVDMLEPAEDEPEEDYDTEDICAFLQGIKIT